MDFRFTEEQEAFRQEFVSWLEQTLHEVKGGDTPRSFESMVEWGEAARDFQKRLFKAGYAMRHYPKEYGGQGRPIEEELIVSETMAAMCTEFRHPLVVTMGLVSPTILTCGTEEQKKSTFQRSSTGHMSGARVSASPMPDLTLSTCRPER